ncbi:uncharacterized protein LOC130630249 isoform X2 [Hydractinia symbiolongicarpus]|uniref:uncharacterized protein LOC130630249 isoform X2 n=1 Tax=Hydractinia symbiolongicarpus TaxID=13093 RepID=UPI002550A73C|nr:uncharacterized protein LOC130630249 isoform X2 [Hydractinia symbiolongicarpus]
MAQSTKENDTNARLNEAIKCNVCLEQLCNPKILQCFHTFCKDCLDHVIQWEYSGAGTIKCPLMCAELTNITLTGTTNDLPPNYNLASVIDVLSSSNSRTCKADENCTSEISRYCAECNVKTCKICWSKHLCNGTMPQVLRRKDGSNESARYTPITFDVKTGCFQPYCEKHSTIAHHLCKTCKNCFVCIYCKHRLHLGHDFSSVKSAAKAIRNFIDSKLETATTEEEDSSELKAILKLSITEFQKTRMLLFQELRNREITIAKDLLESLAKEESTILKTFDDEVRTFYNEIALFLDKGKLKESLEFLTEIKNKEDFCVIKSTKRVKSKIDKLLSSTVPTLNVNLGDIQPVPNSYRQYLGVLDVERQNEPKKSLTSFVQCKMKNIEMSNVYSNAARKLKQFPLLLDKFGKHENEGTVVRYQRVPIDVQFGHDMANCITMMDEYSQYSLEELRLVDYILKRKGFPSRKNVHPSDEKKKKKDICSGYDFSSMLSPDLENLSFTDVADVKMQSPEKPILFSNTSFLTSNCNGRRRRRVRSSKW